MPPPAPEPATPPELSDRAADHWEPLLAISDAAAGTWPQRARQVAVILAQVRDTDTEALAVRLLADIRQVFRAAGDPDRLFSHRLLEDLHRLEEAPWADLPAPGGGPPGLRPHRLASLLRGFDIRSTTIRPPAGAPAKGYYRVMFEKPWQRYLPAPPDPDPAPEHPTGEPAGDGAMAGSLGLLEEGGGA